MTNLEVTMPELILVAATRGMLGAGFGLLLAGRLSDEQRKTAGRILLGIGLASTLPLAFQLFGHRKGRGLTEHSERDRAGRIAH